MDESRIQVSTNKITQIPLSNKQLEVAKLNGENTCKHCQNNKQISQIKSGRETRRFVQGIGTPNCKRRKATQTIPSDEELPDVGRLHNRCNASSSCNRNGSQ